MQSKAKTVTQYLDELPPDRKSAMTRLRKEVKNNLPVGFEETMTYGMISYVVPHSVYPPGYHVDAKQALPFISIASQKNYISFYHMALYADALLPWFQKRWSTETTQKLDMGKSCVRFKKLEDIPFTLIGELAGQMTAKQWIAAYKKSVNLK